MSIINVLDSKTINQIAAGEVVERPSSVVKELVENAIDAKASAITVEIKEGGISFIRITDNGMGMTKEDIPIAFLRHATSKIKSVEDLLVVSSLGFRGEALSSISSVSQVELITKTSQALLGNRYVIEGGIEKEFQEIGCPSGTTIIVRNLFYNTPARRKFLKTAMTEAGYIGELIQRLALSHPEISFKFINNNQTKLHTLGNLNFKDIIYNIYGRELTANLLPVQLKTQDVEISGFIGKPIVCRGNRGYENYFINGRYIKSAIITKAIEEAYKTFIMVHKYPMTAIHLKIDSKFIDVNVHPTKMEIRFNNNEEIYKAVFHAVRNALEGKELIPETTFANEKEERQEQIAVKKALEAKQKAAPKPPEPFETKRREAFLMKETQKNYESKLPNTITASKKDEVPVQTNNIKPPKSPAKVIEVPIKTTNVPTINNTSTNIELSKKQDQPVKNQVKNEQFVMFDDKLLSQKAREKHKIIGQLFDTYWMVEYEQKLFIIDQHAAHEKVLYEKLVHKFREKTFSPQYLSPPIIVTLTLKEEEIVKNHLDTFLKYGFEVEPFGGNEYAIRSVPMDLYGYSPKDLVLSILDALSTEHINDNINVIADRLATAACKAAVKGNQKLSLQEADALIDQLLQAQNPYTCPHGRPTIISMTKYELEKKFKRIQD